MTPHEINQIVSRTWINHQKHIHNPWQTKEFEDKFTEIKKSFFKMISDKYYQDNKEMIDFVEANKGKLSIVHTYDLNGQKYPGKYPLTIQFDHFGYTWWNMNMRDYQPYIDLKEEMTAKEVLLTTDRGLFFVMSMLLYKPEMNKEDFYLVLVKHFKIVE